MAHSQVDKIGHWRLAGLRAEQLGEVADRQARLPGKIAKGQRLLDMIVHVFQHQLQVRTPALLVWLGRQRMVAIEQQ